MSVAADALPVAVPVVPSLAEAKALSAAHNLIPVCHTFTEDCETPVSAFLKLRELAPAEPAFLLESAEQGQRVGRYSFIGFRPRSVLRWSLADGGDPYARAAAEVARAVQAPVPGAPPFAGGAVGYFGYDLVRMVERIVEYIFAGDAFQVVPSQRWSAPVPVEAFSIYRGLRAINPSPYMYYLDFADFQIAGASPEPLLTVHGRRVSTKPIAGTRPRGSTPEEDRTIAAELLADEKERAEHVMLVDLGRNDLGRVCEFGTVVVDELMEIESYSHVMHIVSSVSGTLREDVGAMDALRSILPAGTLSGAPKVRAMEIIDELEPIKRGGYGGAIGYLSYSGDLDTCIHIRTVVIKDGTAHIQAGAGVVADSDPASEHRETLAKAEAVFSAIKLACAQQDWA